MKAYTNLEQSKKLAEILPLESADMAWCNNSIRGVNYTDSFSANLYTVKEMRETFDAVLRGWDKYWKLIPCWSLAALLGILPKEIEIDGQRYAPCLFPVQDKWLLKLWYNSNYTITSPIAIFSDSPIDACYEMILKLYERKML